MDNQRLIQNEKLWKAFELINLISTKVTSGVQEAHLLLLGFPPVPVEYPCLFWLLSWSFPTRCFHRAVGGSPQPDNGSRTPIRSPLEGMRPWHPHYRPRSVTLHTLYSRRKISRVKVGMCHSNITDFQNVQQRNIGTPLEKICLKGKYVFRHELQPRAYAEGNCPWGSVRVRVRVSSMNWRPALQFWCLLEIRFLSAKTSRWFWQKQEDKQPAHSLFLSQPLSSTPRMCLLILVLMKSERTKRQNLPNKGKSEKQRLVQKEKQRALRSKHSQQHLHKKTFR